MAIVIVGMLDERKEALRELKNNISIRNHETMLADISFGSGAGPADLQADISLGELARAGGSTIEAVREMLLKEREKATTVVSEGLARILLDLHKKGELSGVIGVGGMIGTFITLNAVKSLPFGMPKLLISSVAAMPAYAKRLAEYFGVSDITVMHSLVDTAGMNPLIKSLMRNGAGAICGMVETYRPAVIEAKPSIAVTEFEFCDLGAHYVRELLNEDYNLVSFHATGVGEKAAVDLVSLGNYEAFIDLVPAGFSEYLIGGNRAAGPDRLDAGKNLGRPYILAPCGFDMISCGPIQRRDEKDPLWTSRNLAERKLLIQDALRVQVRTSPEEMRVIARAVAAKLNQYQNLDKVKFIIPLRGFSSLSVEGGALYDPRSDQAFIEEFKRNVHQDIEVVEVDTHINTPEFARALVDVFLKIRQQVSYKPPAE